MKFFTILDVDHFPGVAISNPREIIQEALLQNIVTEVSKSCFDDIAGLIKKMVGSELMFRKP